MRIIKIGGGVISHIQRFREHLNGDIYIHGASDYVDEICKEAGMEIQRYESVSGIEFRYTPKKILKYYIMGVMRANKELVSYLHSIGVDAIGVSGIDGGLVRAKRKKIIKIVLSGKKKVLRDDYSGLIESIDAVKLKVLMNLGVPVLAPLALSEEHVPLNIDGDTLAVKVARILNARTLVFLSETALVENGHVVEDISQDNIEQYFEVTSGGMRRKLLSAQLALQYGLAEIRIEGLNGTTVIR